MLDKKLQIKDGQTIALLHTPYDVPVTARQVAAEQADAVLVFVTNKAELDERTEELRSVAQAGLLARLAYPKAKQLHSDINRDIIRDYAIAHRLDTVRQIAIDATWSALRLKVLASRKEEGILL